MRCQKTGIWIRSQNKEKLVNVNEIEIGIIHEIVFYDISGDNIFLGDYSTIEKALKVLDMIETHLEELEYKFSNREVVFQMPQDDEVKEND